MRKKSKKLSWKTEKRKIKDLKLFENNPRKMTKKQAEDLLNSIKKFNLVEIPAIDQRNRVIAGNMRIRALKELGREKEEIEVRVPNRPLSEKEAKEYLLRSNKNTGEWDWDLLSNFDEEILKNVGFEDIEIDKIFPPMPDEKDDEIPPVPEKPKSKIGDIYQLGKHRLMCGDSTKKEDVEKLMDGKKADMVFTDPPYNVNYGSSKKPRHKIRNLVGDNQTAEEWENFNKNWIRNVIEFYKGGDLYCWGASGPEGMRQRLWLVGMGFHWSATIIWKKDRLILTPAKYQRMYEPCFYGWYKKSSYRGSRKETEVWEIKRPSNSEEHPTMKPVELCQRAIKNSSKRGDIVMDLFAGSGSTLIACEKTNRICYGLEIDPHYCDIIIKRWEDYTDKKARKVEKL